MCIRDSTSHTPCCGCGSSRCAAAALLWLPALMLNAVSRNCRNDAEMPMQNNNKTSRGGGSPRPLQSFGDQF
eukprot:5584769-Alexandrium_andersonii.AAC.1